MKCSFLSIHLEFRFILKIEIKSRGLLDRYEDTSFLIVKVKTVDDELIRHFL